VDLHEADGVTTLTYRLAFRDKAGPSGPAAPSSWAL
jgi:hypothetical protein